MENAESNILTQYKTLKSAEELAKEEEESQKIKLQELLRRGGVENLQEANRLMKILAGYENQNKTDYRAKAAEEVVKVQEKAKLLEERLQDLKPGDQLTEGDVFEVCGLPAYSCCLRLISGRTSLMPCKVLSQRYRRCARKNQMTMKLSRSYLRSMTVYTGR